MKSHYLINIPSVAAARKNMEDQRKENELVGTNADRFRIKDTKSHNCKLSKFNSYTRISHFYTLRERDMKGNMNKMSKGFRGYNTPNQKLPCLCSTCIAKLFQ